MHDLPQFRNMVRSWLSPHMMQIRRDFHNRDITRGLLRSTYLMLGVLFGLCTNIQDNNGINVDKLFGSSAGRFLSVDSRRERQYRKAQ